MKSNHLPSFDNLTNRSEEYCCPATQTLIALVQGKILDLQTLSRAASRRKDKAAEQAYDDMNDELIIILDDFLSQAEAQHEDCEPGPEIGSN